MRAHSRLPMRIVRIYFAKFILASEREGERENSLWAIRNLNFLRIRGATNRARDTLLVRVDVNVSCNLHEWH